MRVYELAKKLGMENRALIPELKRLGIAVSSHSSTLDDAAVRRILEKLMPQAAEVKDHGRSDGVRDEVTQKGLKKGSVSAKEAALGREVKTSDGRELSKGQALKGTAASEEPSKSDKKRILIKRKRTEEELGAEPIPRGVLPVETPSPPVNAPQTTPQAPVAPLPTSLPSASTVSEIPSGNFSSPTMPVEREKVVEEVPREIGLREPAPVSPPVLQGQAATSSIASEMPSAEKKRGTLVEPSPEDLVGLKEKFKKPKKPGRTRDDEEFRFREDAARWQDLRAIP
ncbi:MAG: hypothetical protein C4293_19755, partial [Nitrospiraceae bacterium]